MKANTATEGDEPTVTASLTSQRFLDSGADFGGILDDPDSRGFQGFHFLVCRAFAARDDRTGMAHAAAGRCSDTGNKADHRFLDVLLDVLGRFFLRIASDFPDHDDGLRLRILLKQR